MGATGGADARDRRTPILVADDDAVSRRLVGAWLTEWGYAPVPVADGEAAWAALREPDGPAVALCDWLMPGLDGPEVCRRVRSREDGPPRYLILLTASGGPERAAEGLGSGADDFVTKPFDHRELKARVAVGVRVVQLESALRVRLQELEEALASVRQLQGLLPICSYCHKVRDDQDYWQQVERYLELKTDVRFSHGVCPACYAEHIEPQLRRLRP